MELLVRFDEIINKISEKTNVNLSLNKETSKDIKISYVSNSILIPNINLSLHINAVSANRLYLTYSCNPIVALAVKNLLPRIIANYLPNGGVLLNPNNEIIVYLEQIKELKKVFDYVELSDISIHERYVLLSAELK